MPCDKLRGGWFSIQAAAQDQCTRSERIIFFRLEKSSHEVPDADAWQMFSQNSCNVRRVQRGEQLRRHQSQSLGHVHLVDERARRLPPRLLADRQVRLVQPVLHMRLSQVRWSGDSLDFVLQRQNRRVPDMDILAARLRVCSDRAQTLRSLGKPVSPQFHRRG